LGDLIIIIIIIIRNGAKTITLQTLFGRLNKMNCELISLMIPPLFGKQEVGI
jgi:hypothetical protein